MVPYQYHLLARSQKIFGDLEIFLPDPSKVIVLKYKVSGNSTSQFLQWSSNKKLFVTKHLHVKTTNLLKCLYQISGGHCPPTFQYDLTQIAENPQDGTVGLILYGGSNFIMAG